MEKGTHGGNEESFEDLSYSGQTKSINGQIRTIEKSIKAHLRKAKNESKDVVEVRNTCINQLQRLIDRL